MLRAAIKLSTRTLAVAWAITWRSAGSLGLILAAVTVALYVRSYGRGDLFGFSYHSWNVSAFLSDGTVLATASFDERDRWKPLVDWSRIRPGASTKARIWFPTEFTWLRLDSQSAATARKGWAVVTAFPIWWFALPGLIIGLPLVVSVTIAVRQWRRRRGFQCRMCGYDLRGTPERCPECGTAPARTQLRDRLWSKSR